jgi:RNA polymerase sigma-70 factor (ECF subfamily)
MFFAGEKKRIRRAFEEEALPHLDALYAVALRLTRNDRDAEDLVQDTILRGFRFFHRFETGTNCKAWLFKILHNTFVNKYRRRLREREVAGSLEASEGLGVLFSQGRLDESRDPERVILDGGAGGSDPERRGLSDDVQRALDGIPEDFRLAVLLCDLEELSYREIADIMDCPVGTVMSRLHRGRRLLQAALRGYAAEQGIGAEPASDGGGAQVIPIRRALDGSGER